jgi:hypothetical protein
MDIVEWLRKRRIPIQYGDWTDYEDDTQCHEAADEIERLRERVAVLEATLEGALDNCKIWERILTKALGEKE